MANFDLGAFAGWLDQNVGQGRKVKQAERSSQIAQAQDTEHQAKFNVTQRQAMSDALGKFMNHNGDVASFNQADPKSAAMLPMIHQYLQGDANIKGTEAGTRATNFQTAKGATMLPYETEASRAGINATKAGTTGQQIHNVQLGNEVNRENMDFATRVDKGLPYSSQGAGIALPYAQLAQQESQHKEAGLLDLIKTMATDPSRMLSANPSMIDYSKLGKSIGYDIPTIQGKPGGGVPGAATAMGVHQAIQGGAGKTAPQPTNAVSPAAAWAVPGGPGAGVYVPREASAGPQISGPTAPRNTDQSSQLLQQVMNELSNRNNVGTKISPEQLSQAKLILQALLQGQ